MAPVFLMTTDPLFMDPWHHLSAAIRDGKSVFDQAYGSSLWEIVSKNPELNKLFNNGLDCSTKILTKAFLMAYKDGFHNIETLVDVGGGKGCLVSEIVKANWPRIQGINFDLQHVVEVAPVYTGVTQVGGDMFESIPSADAIIMKSVLHDWSDEDCKKILRNCKRALLKTKGKLILFEIVIQQEGEGLIEETLKFDLLMMVHCVGGRERTQAEWTNLLEDIGFSQLKFIKTPEYLSIIEAYAS